MSDLNCEHYKRHCHLKCNICNEFYPCRFCHDNIKSHLFNRKEVIEIKCLKCEYIQKPQEKCEKCDIVFAKYFCNICNLFDDEGDEKGIWHCDSCGICRIGGKDNFFHCDICKSCLSINNKENHKCLPDILNNDCPFCLEDMFNSRDAATPLKCGHYLHSNCYKLFFENPNGLLRCPICSKSCFDMSKYWEYLDNAIINTPMQEDLKINVNLICCDCNKESETIFNFIGLKCKLCGSYNTKQLK